MAADPRSAAVLRHVTESFEFVQLVGTVPRVLAVAGD
jgi:hypothetical protein